MKQPGKWFQIRHDLYKHVHARVTQRIGAESAELRKYRARFEKDLARRWQRCELEELLKKVEASDIIFLSDFHALRQSQRTHLRILKKTVGDRPIVLAVECIDAEFQEFIDQYLANDISEKEFLVRVGWDERWGFPWDNYKPLFDWARQYKISVVGLNKNIKNKNQMRLRDEFAAKKILEIKAAAPEARIFVIYGDMHLASSHLPKLVSKSQGRQLRILQNAEKIYFKIFKKTSDGPTEIVRLSPDCYCVLNVPPWVKWQSYLMFLEETYDRDLDEALDFTDHVLGFAKLVANQLNIKISFADLSVYSARDSGFWSQLESHYSKAEQATLAGFIDEESSFYLPGLRMGYLSRASVNQAASLAMEYVLCKVSETSEDFLVPSKHLNRWIWVKGWAYFGGKLINPKRKTDTLMDIKSRLTSKKGKTNQEPLKLALYQKTSELMAAKGFKLRGKKFRPQKNSSYVIAAELLGGLMGERIYQAYISGKLSGFKIKQLMAVSIQDSEFDEHYFRFIRFIESVPLSFKSKEERI